MERCRHRDALVLTNNLRRERNVRRNPLVVCRNEETRESPATSISSSVILPDVSVNSEEHVHLPNAPGSSSILLEEEAQQGADTPEILEIEVIPSAREADQRSFGSSVPSPSIPPDPPDGHSGGRMRDLERVDYRNLY